MTSNHCLLSMNLVWIVYGIWYELAIKCVTWPWIHEFPSVIHQNIAGTHLIYLYAWKMLITILSWSRAKGSTTLKFSHILIPDYKHKCVNHTGENQACICKENSIKSKWDISSQKQYCVQLHCNWPSYGQCTQYPIQTRKRSICPKCSPCGSTNDNSVVVGGTGYYQIIITLQ